jgi:hypothetical protein
MNSTYALRLGPRKSRENLRYHGAAVPTAGMFALYGPAYALQLEAYHVGNGTLALGHPAGFSGPTYAMPSGSLSVMIMLNALELADVFTTHRRNVTVPPEDWIVGVAVFISDTLGFDTSTVAVTE